MSRAAVVIASRPEAQLRWTVCAMRSRGTPDISAMTRAMLAASAGVATLPKTTWSICSGRMPRALEQCDGGQPSQFAGGDGRQGGKRLGEGCPHALDDGNVQHDDLRGEKREPRKQAANRPLTLPGLGQAAIYSRCQVPKSTAGTLTQRASEGLPPPSLMRRVSVTGPLAPGFETLICLAGDADLGSGRGAQLAPQHLAEKVLGQLGHQLDLPWAVFACPGAICSAPQGQPRSSLCPGRGTTSALTASPFSASGTPMTAASATSG